MTRPHSTYAVCTVETLSLDWESVLRWTETLEHVPVWDQRAQRDFVVYFSTWLALPSMVVARFEGRRKKNDVVLPHWDVVDGRERICALRAYARGELTVTAADLPPGPVGAGILSRTTVNDAGHLLFEMAQPIHLYVLRSPDPDVIEYVRAQANKHRFTGAA